MRPLRFIVAFAITAVIIGELVARFGLGLGSPPLYLSHPTIEYMFQTNQDVSRFGNQILINEYGMRSKPFPKDKDENELRIMVFGDSVLNGGNLTDQQDLATTITEITLAETTHKAVIVGNVSAGSWGPGNYLAYANEFGFFQANKIGLVISSHDYIDDRTFYPLNKNTHPTDQPVSALIEGIERYLPRYLPKLNSGDSHEVDPPPDETQATKVLGELAEFLMLAKQTAPVVVFQHWEKPEIESNKQTTGSLRITELCQSIGVPVVSMRPKLVMSLADGQDPFRDNIHLNDVGQKLLAELMIESFSD